MRKQHTFASIARKDIAFDKISFLISYLSISYLNLILWFFWFCLVMKKTNLVLSGYEITVSVVFGCLLGGGVE